MLLLVIFIITFYIAIGGIISNIFLHAGYRIGLPSDPWGTCIVSKNITARAGHRIFDSPWGTYIVSKNTTAIIIILGWPLLMSVAVIVYFLKLFAMFLGFLGTFASPKEVSDATLLRR